jgi:hypothetical protein
VRHAAPLPVFNSGDRHHWHTGCLRQIFLRPDLPQSC